MPQKLLEPFKKLPQQFQNLNIIQRFHDFTSRSLECFDSHPEYNGGCLECPSAISFENNLGLLAIGNQNGVIKIYGSPGLVFSVQNTGPSIAALAFIPHEVRLISASGNGQVTLFELTPSDGSWRKCCSVIVPLIENEVVTSMVLGHGVIYTGSSTGTLRQIAVKDGRLSLGDDLLTACTSAMLAGSLPLDKRDRLTVDASIVSLELQPNGDKLLIAYADGCVAVAVPQPVIESQPQKTDNQQTSPETPTDTQVAPTAEAEVTVTPVTGEEAPVFPPQRSDQERPTTETQDSSDKFKSEASQSHSLPSTPVKSHSEKRSTLKLRTLTRGWRTITAEKTCEADSFPPLAVPPAPRISHLMLRDQAVQYATWRQLATHTIAEEVTVAYGDGAFQVWPISFSAATIDDQQSLLEPIIVPKRDHPSMPYGPLPCGAINKILIHPSVTGGVFSAFSGGLPRPAFEDRHAVTVLLDQEHHVCFQFGSCVKDFFFIPRGKEIAAPEAPIESIKPFDCESAAALLVLTDRELVAIDLTQPTWPTYFSPYLTCLDASPVTALAHVGKVPATAFSDSKVQWPIWGGLSSVVKSETVESCADATEISGNDLVLLGHADGSISLLRLRPGDCAHLVGRIHTYNLFQPANEKTGGQEVESWPPFRRVGMCISPPGVASFGDPRLAITHLLAEVERSSSSVDGSTTDTLTVVAGGAGGQVTVWSTAGGQTPFEPDVRRILVDLIDPDVYKGKYAWAGGLPLRPFEGAFSPVPLAAPFALHLSPCALIQVEPATAVTALAWEMSWHLAAVGTVFGFAVVDMLAKSPVYTDFLLARLSPVGTHSATTSTNLAVTAATRTANSVASMQSAIVQRSKQLTVNVRQSFRRLKHLRTSSSAETPRKEHHNEGTDNEEAAGAAVEEPAATETKEADVETVEHQPPPDQESNEPVNEVAPNPVESIEESKGANIPTAINGDDSGEVAADVGAIEKEKPILSEPVIVLTDSSVATECQHAVCSLLFSDTFVVSPASATVTPQRSPSLWVGTSAGRVLAHILDWPSSSGPVTTHLAMELQLQHQARVIGIAVLNASANRSPVENNEKTRHSHEPAVEASADKAEPVVAESVAHGDTKAPPADAPAAPQPEAVASPAPTPSESHQLLICSSEQVKLFTLPALRALHKHKVVSSAAEHLNNLLHSSLSSKLSPAAAATAAVEPENHFVGEGETEREQQEAVSEHGEADPKCSTTTPLRSGRQLHRKALTGFALQQFTKTCGTIEWTVVASRRDGKAIVLSLPTLRRLFKAAASPFVGHNPSSVCAHVAKSIANTVFWWCSNVSLLVAVELGNKSELTPKVMFQGNIKTGLIVPEWARPRKPSNAVKAGVTKIQEATALTNGQPGDECEAPSIGKDKENDENNEASSCVAHIAENEAVNGVSKTSEASSDLAKIGGPSITAVGDVTVDSIKEYLNGDDKGQMTVKTIETSTEKHTIVEAGRVVTTLHETEMVDGKVVKDDLVKISSDDPGGVLQTTTGSS